MCLLLFIYLFIFVNTKYISFDNDVLLEFFTHLDWVQPNSRGQDMSYPTTLNHGLSPSIGIVSIPYGPVHPETSALVFFSHFQFVVFNAFTIFIFFFGICLVHGPFKSIILPML